MNNIEKWFAAVEEIIKHGSPEIRQKLEQYNRRYIATCKHCWVPKARRQIMEAWEKEKAVKGMVPNSVTDYIEENEKRMK